METFPPPGNPGTVATFDTTTLRGQPLQPRPFPLSMTAQATIAKPSMTPPDSPSLGVLLLAHTEFSSPFVVGSHHLLRILKRARDIVVVGIEPFAGWRSSKLKKNNSSSLAPRLWIPLRAKSPLMREQILTLNARLFRRQLAKTIKHFPRERYVILDNPYAVDIACWLQTQGFRFIVRLTDWMPGQIPSPDRETNFRMLRKALAQCDAVITTSAPLARYVKIMSGRTASVVTNGVDSFFLHHALESGERDLQRVIYYGALDDRIDLVALCDLATRLPAQAFDIYTPSSWATPADFPANVHWHGPIRYEDLPRILSKYNFALLPFTNCSSNHGRFPMKLFEMIGSGVQVIAPPLRSLQELKDHPGVHLSKTFGGAALAQTLGTAWSQWADLSPADQANVLKNLRAAASEQTWEKKVTEILALCRSQN